MIRKLIFYIVFAFLALPSFAQKITFEAYSDARQVVQNGYFEVSFTLKNARGNNFVPPKFNGFEILSGPSSSMSTQIINGKVTQEMGYSYTLQPTKIGTFTIGSASIRAGNKTYNSAPLKIEVVKGKANTGNNNANGQEVFIRTEANTTEAYIGQQILVDYKLYTTVDIDSYSTIDESDYQGFYAQSIKRFNSRVLREVIDGVQYTTKILKRVALFPQQAGSLTIEPMKMQLGLVQGGGRRSGFFFQKNIRPMNVTTEPLNINVRILPPNAPTSFNGAIGNYNLSAQVSPTNVTTDDAISIVMTINGNGDIKRVQPPTLTLPSIFEIYEPNTKDEMTSENQGQILGRKTFEYLVLPKQPGQYRINPTFTYFNPDSVKYLTLTANPTTVNVRKGLNSNTRLNTSPQSNEIQTDIRFIKMDTKLKKKGGAFIGSVGFWVLWALPFLLLFAALIYRRMLAQRGELDLSLIKSKKANKVALKKLATAKKYLDSGNSKAFYDEISRASLGYVSDKLNIPTSDLTKSNVSDRLKSLSVSQENIDHFIKILTTCEMALFAGKDNSEAMTETYNSAIEVVTNIENEITGA